MSHAYDLSSIRDAFCPGGKEVRRVAARGYALNKDASPRRFCGIWALSFAAVLLLASAGFRMWGWYRMHTYMRPYRSLVSEHRTEREIVARQGKPHWMLTSDKQLEKFSFHSLVTPGRMHVESKVLVYYADPWGDGDGYVVYIFLDRHGVASQAVLASH